MISVFPEFGECPIRQIPQGANALCIDDDLIQRIARRLVKKAKWHLKSGSGIRCGMPFDPQDENDSICWVRQQLLGCSSKSRFVRSDEAFAWTIVKREFFNAIRGAERKVAYRRETKICDSVPLGLFCDQSRPDDRRLNGTVIHRPDDRAARSSFELADELVDIVSRAANVAIERMKGLTVVKCILRIGWRIQYEFDRKSEMFSIFASATCDRRRLHSKLTVSDCEYLDRGFDLLRATTGNFKLDFANSGLSPPHSDAWRVFQALCGRFR